MPEIFAHIRDRPRSSPGSHGRPRVTEALNEPGLRAYRRRAGPLMRWNAIQVIRSRKLRCSTDSNHAFNIASNLMRQDLSAGGPDQKRAGDITVAVATRTNGVTMATWMREGWACPAVITGLFSGRVVGWAISNRREQDLAISAWNMAIGLRRRHLAASTIPTADLKAGSTGRRNAVVDSMI